MNQISNKVLKSIIREKKTLPEIAREVCHVAGVPAMWQNYAAVSAPALHHRADSATRALVDAGFRVRTLIASMNAH